MSNELKIVEGTCPTCGGYAVQSNLDGFFYCHSETCKQEAWDVEKK